MRRVSKIIDQVSPTTGAASAASHRLATGTRNAATGPADDSSSTTSNTHQATHAVFNQAKPFENYNFFKGNKRLQECVAHFTKVNNSSTTTVVDPKAYFPVLERHAADLGSAENLRSAEIANKQLPVFTPFDRYGNRVNGVTFTDHWFKMLDVCFKHNAHNYTWTREGAKDPSAHVRRGAQSLMEYTMEQGHGCPTTMSFACFPVLAENNDGTYGDFTPWLQKLMSTTYDGRDVHISSKSGIMIGMSMTEKQGGSDVRANTSTAVLLDASNSSSRDAEGHKLYSLTGHKWFTSAPMCDGFLTLANTEAGSTCFLVPRWLTPSQRNEGLKFQRLKDKLGDKSNASSEVEYDKAIGYLVGKEGQGIKTIMTMVGLTRLDCTLGSAGLMNISLMHAINHVRHREAFGKSLIDQPGMLNVLCDLALEAEAATALAMRVSAAVDQAATQGQEAQSFFRIACAIAKYHICKTGPAFVYEALECHGGNGYVEDFPMARYYRQAPLNPIWEGSGNVMVLDVFRALTKEKGALPALANEVRKSNNEFLMEDFKATAEQLQAMKPAEAVLVGRRLVERLAAILQACALIQTSSSNLLNADSQWIADWFIDSRLKKAHGRHYGTLEAFDPVKGRQLVERLFVE